MSGWLSVPKKVRNISLIRSARLSLRHHGRCIVGRGSRVRIERGARIEFDPGSRLIIGEDRLAPMPCRVILRRNSRFSVRGEVELMRGTKVVVSESAHLEIGDHSYIHCNSTVTCFEHISIGRDCAISWNTNVLDGNSHDLTIEGVPRLWSAPIVIADSVWIGAGALVLSGVTIGSGAVVGAGSVVTKDVPERTVVAGNPARVIGKNAEWAK
jgi:tetrahydrodipicolinate N-acetyltransferase